MRVLDDSLDENDTEPFATTAIARTIGSSNEAFSRSFAQCAALLRDSTVVVVGGIEDPNRVTWHIPLERQKIASYDVRLFDWRTGAWTMQPTTGEHAPLFGIAMTSGATPNSLLVFGGSRTGNHVYELSTDSWTWRRHGLHDLNMMPKTLCFATATTVGHYVFIIGGL